MRPTPGVVDGFGERLVHHLERVDRGGQHRVWANHAGLDQEGHLEVCESSALTDARTLAVPGHAAADDQLYRRQLCGCDLAGLGPALLGGRLPGVDAQVRWVQQLEGSSSASRGIAMLLPPCEICTGPSRKELHGVEDRDSAWKTPGQWPSMAGSAVMILHGFRAHSPVVPDTGCCPSAARRRRPPTYGTTI